MKFQILINEQLNKYNKSVEILEHSFKDEYYDKQIFNIDQFVKEKNI